MEPEKDKLINKVLDMQGNRDKKVAHGRTPKRVIAIMASGAGQGNITNRPPPLFLQAEGYGYLAKPRLEDYY